MPANKVAEKKTAADYLEEVEKVMQDAQDAGIEMEGLCNDVIEHCNKMLEDVIDDDIDDDGYFLEDDDVGEF